MTLTIKDIIIRILMAVVIGGMIGYERELKSRAAGFRTHILVCLGATIISLLQIQIANQAIEMIQLDEKLWFFTTSTTGKPVYIHTHVVFQILFPYRLLNSIF